MRQTTTIHATLSVRVPVNAAGDLAEGATTVVSRVDGVHSAEEPTVRGLEPGLNDTVVDLEIRLAVAEECLPDVGQTLEEGVGIVSVADVLLEDGIDPPARPPPVG